MYQSMHQSIDVERREIAGSFRVGRVVVLKSGGPPMTVDAVTRQDLDGDSVEMVSVMWFCSASSLARHVFPAACLNVVEAPGEGASN